MTSHASNSRINTSSSVHSVSQIVEFVNNYCEVAQRVKHVLAKICRELSKKGVPTHDVCSSLLQALRDMRPSLALLCSTFEEVNNLPDSFISLHINVYILVRDIQNQVTLVESSVKRCYELILISALQEVIGLREELLDLLRTFHALLNKGLQFLKKAFPQTLEYSPITDRLSPPERNESQQSENKHNQTDTLLVQTSSSSSIKEQAQRVPQDEPRHVSSQLLSSYKRSLEKHQNHLSDIEERKAQFADPRHIPLELEEQEKALQKEVQRLSSEIEIAEQSRAL